MTISETNQPVRLVWPAHDYLASYVAALEQGWSPNNLRPEVAQKELLLIQADPARFLDGLVDRDARGSAVILPDGTTIPRLPGYRRWLWDGEFCGSIGLRWVRGTNTLPDYYAETRDALVWITSTAPRLTYGISLEEGFAGLEHGYQSACAKLSVLHSGKPHVSRYTKHFRCSSRATHTTESVPLQEAEELFTSAPVTAREHFMRHLP